MLFSLRCNDRDFSSKIKSNACNEDLNNFIFAAFVIF